MVAGVPAMHACFGPTCPPGLGWRPLHYRYCSPSPSPSLPLSILLFSRSLRFRVWLPSSHCSTVRHSNICSAHLSLSLEMPSCGRGEGGGSLQGCSPFRECRPLGLCKVAPGEGVCFSPPPAVLKLAHVLAQSACGFFVLYICLASSFLGLEFHSISFWLSVLA